MTTTEQIVWAHRVDKDCRATLKPGRDAARLRRSAAGLRRHRAVLRSTRSTRSPAARRSSRGRPRSPTITSSSPARRRRQADGDRPRVRAACTTWRSRTTRRRATASSISIFPNRAWCCRDSSFPAPTRTAARTARTAPSASASARRRSGSGGRPATSTSRSRRQRRVVFSGRLQPVGQRQGHRPRAAAPLGREAVAGHVGRARRRDRQLPIAYRNTIANMMAEAEALNGIFAPDEITHAWYRAKGMTDLPVSAVAPGADARCTRSTRRLSSATSRR